MPHPITLAILDHPGLWVALDFDSALSGIRHSDGNAACGITVAPVRGFAIRQGVNWNRFNSYSATAPSKPRNDIWARGKDWFKQSMITSESNHRVAPREPLYRKCDFAGGSTYRGGDRIVQGLRKSKNPTFSDD